MKIAIDKSSIGAYKEDDNEYIYVFDDEPLKELLQTNLHCMNYKLCTFVDINLTDFDIECIKKAKVTDKNYDKLPEKIDYRYAIIVPNYNNDHGDYNGKTFLRNCIESILNQTYKNFDLILVDDMSTDTSLKTMGEYSFGENLNRVHIIENKRKRYNGGSRNVGIDYALESLDFDYFCFLDSDDWWKHENVLKDINNRLYGHEMALIGMELIDKSGVFMTKFHEYKNYQDFFICDNKVWCTAWSRVIRKDKIVHFQESTLMEDRTWAYEQADQIDDLSRVLNIKEVCYVWNRTNVTNSVSIVRNKVWDASAWKHIGEQLMLIERLRHKEMADTIQSRVNVCISKIKSGVYQQY